MMITYAIVQGDGHRIRVREVLPEGTTLEQAKKRARVWADREHDTMHVDDMDAAYLDQHEATVFYLGDHS